jgi:hypothetical protein
LDVITVSRNERETEEEKKRKESGEALLGTGNLELWELTFWTLGLWGRASKSIYLVS